MTEQEREYRDLKEENQRLKHEAMRRDDDRWDEVNSKLEEIKSSVDEVNATINGTATAPEKGFKVRLDRLEQNDKDRTWFNRAVLFCIIGLMIKAVWSAMKGP